MTISNDYSQYTTFLLPYKLNRWMRNTEMCTQKHKHRMYDYMKQTHECMNIWPLTSSVLVLSKLKPVSAICGGMYGRLVEVVLCLEQDLCSLFHCSQYQYVQSEGLVGYTIIHSNLWHFWTIFLDCSVPQLLLMASLFSAIFQLYIERHRAGNHLLPAP